MTTLGPKCGTSAGAHVHWDNRESMCDPCARAAMRIRKRNILNRMAGTPAMIDKTGTLRRIRALQRLGWTVKDIAERSGIPQASLSSLIMYADKVSRAHADTIARAYDDMCMTVPQGRYSLRNRLHAEKQGWAAPLDWDEGTIDDPDAEPVFTAETRDEIDEAVVLALLAGRTVPSSKPERCEAMRRWLAMGRSEKSLCDAHGWKDGRYTAREEPAA